MPNLELLSQSQRKLARLGIHLPLFPLTTIGSFPKPSDLVELKKRVLTGFQQPEDLFRKEKMLTDQWIRDQDRNGMDVLVDGQLNRSDMVNYFSQKIAGFETGGWVRCYGNRYYRKPIIQSKLAWKEPLITDHWSMTQRNTHKPVKAILTGAYTLFDWSFNEYYTDREKGIRDLAEILKKEVDALVNAGAKIIQIDEHALSARPDEFSLVSDSLKTILADCPCYVILHHAYGDVTPLWQKIQRLPVDNLCLETTNLHFSVLPLAKKIPTKKDMTIGIIDAHRHEVEPAPLVADRIRRARRVLNRNQIWFSPDSGLKTRTLSETQKKLAVLTSSVMKARKTVKKK